MSYLKKMVSIFAFLLSILSGLMTVYDNLIEPKNVTTIIILHGR